MADLMGVKLNLVVVAWEGIIPGLQVGKYDVIICGLTRKMERTLKIGFSDPYFRTGQMVLINKDRLPNITSLSQLNDPAVDITVMQGTSGHVATMKALPNAHVLNYTSREEAAMMVGMGRADAFVFDEPLIRYYLAKYAGKTYTVEDQYLTTENLCFGVRWGDPMWRDWLNIFIYQLKNVIWTSEEDAEKSTTSIHPSLASQYTTGSTISGLSDGCRKPRVWRSSVSISIKNRIGGHQEGCCCWDCFSK